MTREDLKLFLIIGLFSNFIGVYLSIKLNKFLSPYGNSSGSVCTLCKGTGKLNDK